MEIDIKKLSIIHFDKICEWFNKPHVQEFYSLRSWTMDEVTQKLIPYLESTSKVHAYICCISEKPIGYIQYYKLKNYNFPDQGFPEDVVTKTAGIDLFIGEEEYLGKGIADCVLELFLQTYIWPRFQYCIVDPDIRNKRSIHFFTKHRFTCHKTICMKDALQRDVTLQLMWCERDNST